MKAGADDGVHSLNYKGLLVGRGAGCFACVLESKLEILEIELSDTVEARRAKMAQLQGSPRSLQLNSQAVHGSVRSVFKHSSKERWTVRIVATPPTGEWKYKLSSRGY